MTSQRSGLRSLLSAAAVAIAAEAVSATSNVAVAQAVFEDVKGRSALLLAGDQGVVGLNTGDGSLQLGLFRLINREPILYGVTVKGKASDGVSSLFRAGRVSPDVGTTLVLGYKPTGQSAISVRWRRDWASANIVDTTGGPAAPRLDKRSTSTWEIGGHVQFAAPQSRLPWFVAVAAGNRRATDYTDRTKATLRTSRSATSSDGAVVTLEQTVDGRIGPVASELIAFADIDLLLVPRFGLPVTSRLFGRGVLGDRDAASKQRSAFGLDIGLHKQGGDPILDRVAALVVQVDEVRPGDTARDLSDRTSVALVANLAPILGRLWSAVSQ